MVYSGFDYRPFVINWCMSLKSIDGYAVDPIERWVLKNIYSYINYYYYIKTMIHAH